MRESLSESQPDSELEQLRVMFNSEAKAFIEQEMGDAADDAGRGHEYYAGEERALKFALAAGDFFNPVEVRWSKVEEDGDETVKEQSQKGVSLHYWLQSRVRAYDHLATTSNDDANRQLMISRKNKAQELLDKLNKLKGDRSVLNP